VDPVRQPLRRPSRSRVVVSAAAKLNLGLAVGPLRPDGYHDLVTIFQSISLADTLVAERSSSGFSLRVTHAAAALRGEAPAGTLAAVPAGAGNLVLRAARLVARRYGLRGGARFRLVKRIPAQAGLGGGSADAAAAIAAMLALHGLRRPRSERLALAAELGSDVPFALVGGSMLGTGRGECLRPIGPVAPFRAIVAVPRWRVATGTAYTRIDKAKYGLTRWAATMRFAASLGRNQVTTSSAARLGNTFERVLGHQKANFDALRARLRAAGLLQPRLTGSGSGVFGILPEGVPARGVAGRFDGNELLFAVRSRRKGLWLRTQP
jgi:4-diphosphocytidyl-2-C-methyl-D-erythritol kinase